MYSTLLMVYYSHNDEATEDHMERDRSTYTACLLDDMLGEIETAGDIKTFGEDLRPGSEARATFLFDGAWYVATVRQVEAP